MSTMHKRGDLVRIESSWEVVRLLEDESVSTGWASCESVSTSAVKRYKVSGLPRVCPSCTNRLFDGGLGVDRGRYCGACEKYV